MVNSVAFRYSEDRGRGRDQIAGILVLDGLISNGTKPLTSQRYRVDYRVLTSIIAFAVAMILLVLAFITMAHAAAPASDRVIDEKVGIAQHQLADLAL
ncbi:hypothetical protein ACIBG0_33680 [Nocardia sp. NPDC050630]|uniref:hypothetical protein n=1 Tax=Nocardia sp. NPDC050630 TaxID=3364321 RepID=UPI0037AB8D4E